MRAGIVYIKIPISSIKFDYIKDDVSALKDSIKMYGLLQPIGVARYGENNYKLIFGNRRLKACMELNQKYIHAVLLSFREDEQKHINAVENIHRQSAMPTLLKLNKEYDLKTLLCLNNQTMQFLVNYFSLSDEAKESVNDFTYKYVNSALGDSRYFLRMVELEKNIPAAAKDKVRLSVLSDKRIFINEIEKILDLMKAGGHNDTVFEDSDRIIIKKNIS